MSRFETLFVSLWSKILASHLLSRVLKQETILKEGVMKKVILMILMVAPIFAQAKVSDFNALITENVQAQQKLGDELGRQVETRRQAFRKNEQPVYLVEQRGESVNVPTDRNMLRFHKEMVDHSVSEKELQKRIASEVKSSELAF